MEPVPEQPKPEPASDQFTLEEWIEATQSCGGIDRPDDDPDPMSPP